MSTPGDDTATSPTPTATTTTTTAATTTTTTTPAAAAGPVVLEVLTGGIQQIRPKGVVFDDLAQCVLNPKDLPSLDTDDPQKLADAILFRLRLAQLPLDFWSTNPVSVTYQNFHRLGKLRCMIELNEYFGRTKTQLGEELLVESINLVIANVFRTFPTKLPDPYPTILPDNCILYSLDLKNHLKQPNDKETREIQAKYEGLVRAVHGGVPLSDGAPPPTTQSEDEVQARDPAWPFVRWVYDYFLRFIVGEVDARTLRKYISQGFILKILDLFHSQDVREREMLKTLLHRIYAKFMTLRAFIRRSLNHVLSIFVYETENLPGVSELLEILGSIINGFAQPLKPEHSVFFEHVLTPMHKVRSLPTYSPQLTYCICQFVLKESQLAIPFVKALIRYWPRTHPNKEALFLEELYEVLERLEGRLLYEIIPSIFHIISPALASSHSHVCGKALTFITSEFILPFAFNDNELFTKHILPSLLTSAEHWNDTLQEQFRLSLQQRVPAHHQGLVADLHQALSNHKAQQEKQKEELVLRKKLWAKFSDQVKDQVAKYPSHRMEFTHDQYLPPY